VSQAGDVNGDGFDDIVVMTECLESKMGSTQIYFGGVDGLNESRSTWLHVANLYGVELYFFRF
jgi:hypothetical protein